MEAKELRIGNLIEYAGDYVSVNTYHISTIEAGKEPFKSRYKPIPLTEEWLVKFGFDKGTMCWFNDTNIGFEFNAKGVVKWNQPKHIKHVHQLQNLYFALTGEELIEH